MKLRFRLDIQLFASHKGVGSTKNGRDSAGRRLGAKRSDGQFCKAGGRYSRSGETGQDRRPQHEHRTGTEKEITHKEDFRNAKDENPPCSGKTF